MGNARSHHRMLRSLVDGEHVLGLLRYNWNVLYEDYLEVLSFGMKAQWLSLPCLAEQFINSRSNVDVVSVQRFAHVYSN